MHVFLRHKEKSEELAEPAAIVEAGSKEGTGLLRSEGEPPLTERSGWPLRAVAKVYALQSEPQCTWN
jgi:hypothetical protein